MAQAYNPPLSCVKLPDYQLGAAAVELLVKQINGAARQPTTTVFQGELQMLDSIQELTGGWNSRLG